MIKPPLELAVEVSSVTGRSFRWDSGAKSAGDVPQGLSFRTKRGDGFADANVTLARRIDRDYVDLHLYDTIAFVGADGSVAYEGRVGGQPRSMDTGHSITVQSGGWMSHAKDRKFTEIYADRDLSRWQPIGTARRISLISNATPWRITDHTVVPDSGVPSIVMSHRLEGGGARPISEAWYDAGPANTVAAVYWEFVETQTQGTDSNWFTLPFSSSSDSAVTETDSDRHDTASASPTSATGTFIPSTARRYAGLQFGYATTTASSAGIDRQCTWRNVAVYGAHGLTVRGTSPGGFYASDLIRDVTGRFCPMLNTDGVQDTIYPIQHAVYQAPVFPYDAYLDFNKYHLWNLAVWENRTLHFEPYDMSDYDWEVRLSDHGVSVGLQGDSIENLANGICVNYEDAVTGKTRRLTPDEYPELADTSESNPANLAGYPVWTEIDLSSPTVEADAVQLGRAALAEFNQPKAAGDITVQGHIRDRAGHWHPVWKVRAGDTIAITDHPNDRPRMIVETDYQHDSRTLRVAVDSTFKRLDAILDRVNAAVGVGALR